LEESSAGSRGPQRAVGLMMMMMMTTHQNGSVLFVKHLAIRTLTRTYRTVQQYTDWSNSFETQEVFVTSAVPILSSSSAVTMKYDCKN
jgi:hypothetical protein